MKSWFIHKFLHFKFEIQNAVRMSTGKIFQEFTLGWKQEYLRGERNGLGRREKRPKKIGRREKGSKKNREIGELA